MKSQISLLFLFAVVTVQANSDQEINHLLNYVADTDCQYERNGNMHNGKEAVNHIRKKYAYYKDDINSAEDFISYAASSSNLTGKEYYIHCHNQPAVSSKDWLMLELHHFRNHKRAADSIQ